MNAAIARWQRITSNGKRPNEPKARYGHVLCNFRRRGCNGALLLWGGGSGNGVLSDSFFFDTDILVWDRFAIDADTHVAGRALPTESQTSLATASPTLQDLLRSDAPGPFAGGQIMDRVPAAAAAAATNTDAGEAMFIFGGILETPAGDFMTNRLVAYHIDECAWISPRITSDWDEGTDNSKECSIDKNKNKLPEACIGASLSCIHNRLYLFGGLGARGNLLNAFYCMDLMSGAPLVWQRLDPAGDVPSPRESHSCTAVSTLGHSGSLVIIGGCDQFRRFNDLYIYDIASNTFSCPTVDGIPPTPRSMHTATLVENRIFLYGGWEPAPSNDQPASNDDHGMSVELELKNQRWRCAENICCFDIDLLKWIPVLMPRGEAPRPRAGHQALKVNQYIYIFAGREEQCKKKNVSSCFQDVWRLEIGIPRAPENVTVQVIEGIECGIVVKWDVPNACEYTYNVEMKNEKDDKWINVFVGLDEGCKISKVENGCTYNVRVRALSLSGLGEWSRVQSVFIPQAAISEPSAEVMPAGRDPSAFENASITSSYKNSENKNSTNTDSNRTEIPSAFEGLDNSGYALSLDKISQENDMLIHNDTGNNVLPIQPKASNEMTSNPADQDLNPLLNEEKEPKEVRIENNDRVAMRKDNNDTTVIRKDNNDTAVISSMRAPEASWVTRAEPIHVEVKLAGGNAVDHVIQATTQDIDHEEFTMSESLNSLRTEASISSIQSMELIDIGKDSQATSTVELIAVAAKSNCVSVPNADKKENPDCSLSDLKAGNGSKAPASIQIEGNGDYNQDGGSNSRKEIEYPSINNKDQVLSLASTAVPEGESAAHLADAVVAAVKNDADATRLNATHSESPSAQILVSEKSEKDEAMALLTEATSVTTPLSASDESLSSFSASSPSSNISSISKKEFESKKRPKLISETKALLRTSFHSYPSTKRTSLSSLSLSPSSLLANSSHGLTARQRSNSNEMDSNVSILGTSGSGNNSNNTNNSSSSSSSSSISSNSSNSYSSNSPQSALTVPAFAISDPRELPGADIIPSTLMLGTEVDVKDREEIWCAARVIKRNEEQKTIFVHYEGWSARYDEHIPFGNIPRRVRFPLSNQQRYYGPMGADYDLEKFVRRYNSKRYGDSLVNYMDSKTMAQAATFMNISDGEETKEAVLKKRRIS